MAKADFDTLVSQLGDLRERARRLADLRERARRLADEDYISAKYKGYSSEGLTLEEVMGALEETEGEIEKLERQLERFDDES